MSIPSISSDIQLISDAMSNAKKQRTNFYLQNLPTPYVEEIKALQDLPILFNIDEIFDHCLLLLTKNVVGSSFQWIPLEQTSVESMKFKAIQELFQDSLIDQIHTNILTQMSLVHFVINPSLFFEECIVDNAKYRAVFKPHPYMVAFHKRLLVYLIQQGLSIRKLYDTMKKGFVLYPKQKATEVHKWLLELAWFNDIKKPSLNLLYHLIGSWLCKKNDPSTLLPDAHSFTDDIFDWIIELIETYKVATTLQMFWYIVYTFQDIDVACLLISHFGYVTSTDDLHMWCLVAGSTHLKEIFRNQLLSLLLKFGAEVNLTSHVFFFFRDICDAPIELDKTLHDRIVNLRDKLNWDMYSFISDTFQSFLPQAWTPPMVLSLIEVFKESYDHTSSLCIKKPSPQFLSFYKAWMNKLLFFIDRVKDRHSSWWAEEKESQSIIRDVDYDNLCMFFYELYEKLL